MFINPHILWIVMSVLLMFAGSVMVADNKFFGIPLMASGIVLFCIGPFIVFN